MDIFNALDANARHSLAQMALTHLLAPREEWITQHETLKQKESLPSSSEIESTLEGIGISIHSDDGHAQASLNSRDVASIARDLGESFETANQRIQEALEANGLDFLQALETSVRWSVAHDLVDCPDLEVEQWMDMARQLGVEYEARDVLMHEAGPDELGRWWAQAPPLSDNWMQAWRTFEYLQGPRKDTLQLQWLEHLFSVPIDTLHSHKPAKVQTQSPDEVRTHMMKGWWAKQVTHAHSCNKNGSEIGPSVRFLEKKGVGDFQSLLWCTLLGDSTYSLGITNPQDIQARLASLFSGHPDLYVAWRDAPQSELPSALASEPEKKLLAARIVKASTPPALRLPTMDTDVRDTPSYSQLAALMEVLDLAASKTGSECGYASALAAASLHMSLDKEQPRKPRPRL